MEGGGRREGVGSSLLSVEVLRIAELVLTEGVVYHLFQSLVLSVADFTAEWTAFSCLGN